MRIVVIGATGTIGAAIAAALEVRHEVLLASRGSCLRADVTDLGSIDALFASVADVDAVICSAASVPMAPLDSYSDDDFRRVLKGKLLGQVKLARSASGNLRDGGSITLTGGAFTHPTPGAAAGALVNAGIEAFARMAATEMSRGLRINVVRPGWVRETLIAMGRDGAEGTPVEDVARAYVRAVEGMDQGQVILPEAGRQPRLANA